MIFLWSFPVSTPVGGDVCVFDSFVSGFGANAVWFFATPSQLAYVECCSFLFLWGSLAWSWCGLQYGLFGPVAATIGGVWVVFAPQIPGSCAIGLGFSA